MKRILSSNGPLLLVQGLGLAIIIAACSSNSGNTESSGSSGSSGDSSGSGSSGSGSSGSGSSGSGSSGDISGTGSSGTTPVAGDGGDCPTETTSALAVHIKLNVTWAATSVLVASNGPQTAEIWLGSALTYTSGSNGYTISGVTKTCGLTLPPIQLSGVVGNEKVKLAFTDNSIWNGPKMPTFTNTGVQGGFTVNSSISIAPAVGILGIAKTSPFANLSMAWPPPSQQDNSSGTWPQFQTTDLSDDDNDGNNGISIDSVKDSTYSYVPASLGYSVAFADKVFIVSRNQIGLTGKVTSCGHSSGTAQVRVFENHVVGCHDGPSSVGPNCEMTNGIVTGGGFIDANRTIYVPGTATYSAVEVPAGDAGNGLPDCDTVRAMAGPGM